MSTPNYYEDVIDSHDVISRIEELESAKEDLEDTLESATDELDEARDIILNAYDGEYTDDQDLLNKAADAAQEAGTLPGRMQEFVNFMKAIEAEKEAQTALADWATSDDAVDLESLLDLQSEAESSPDWQYGEALIRDSYFKDYAQQFAEDIGAIDPNASWPTRCIDWDQAAFELQRDYFSVDFDGVTYWIRS